VQLLGGGRSEGGSYQNDQQAVSSGGITVPSEITEPVDDLPF
jgi:hypothetical protein